MKSDFWGRLTSISWALLLVSLPFTSFPLVSRLFNNTSVAPLASVFLAILAIFYLLSHSFKVFSLPIQSIPIVLFVILCLITTLLAYFIPFPTFRESPVWKNAVEGIVTLLVGISFYIMATRAISSTEDIKKTLYWINWGGIFIIVVCLIQAISWNLLGKYPPILRQIQHLFTINGTLYIRRVTGVAFEPSWLAHQLNILYLPIWLGASLTNFTIYKKKIFRIFSIENILLIFGWTILFFSFSRIGWLTTLLSLGFILFRTTNLKIGNWIKKRQETFGKKYSLLKGLVLRLVFWFLIICLFFILLILVGVLLTRIDPRMKDLFDIDRYRQFGLLGWASKLSFAERIIYWMTGYRVFQEYPWIGVGIGGAGFFFPIVVPEFGYNLPEIFRMIAVNGSIPNAKNLCVRLLAETGIVGFVIFVSWIYSHWYYSATLEKKRKTEIEKTMGIVGKLFVLAMVFEGFSMDTFGLPYYWIALGLLAGTYRINQNV